MFPTISTIEKAEKYLNSARWRRTLGFGWGLLCFVIPFVPPYLTTGWGLFWSLYNLVIAGWLWTQACRRQRDVQVFSYIKYLAEEIKPEEYTDDDHTVIKVWNEHLKDNE